MNEKEMMEEAKKELEKLPEVRCYDCENLCVLGDGTEICAVLSVKDGLVVIEDSKRKIKCPYFSPLPAEVIAELEKESEEKEGLFEDEDEESEEDIDDIESLDDLLKE